MLHDKVSEQIAKLECQGIIEEVDTAEWVSPILVVNKPNKTIRTCVDLRGPIQAVVIDSFPLPHIEELLNSMQRASLFSKLDLASTCHQVWPNPASQSLTSFITHEELFHFTYACFDWPLRQPIFSK